MGSRGFGWYNAASSSMLSPGAPVGPPTPIILTHAGNGGVFRLALAGHDWAENAVPVSGLPQEFVDAVEREYLLTRIVGTLSFRMATPFDVDPGANGANALWLIRVGFIVVETDGNLGVPSVALDGKNTKDSEISWLFTDQFTVVGVDRGASNFIDHAAWTANADGLNHYLVNRDYDIGVNRIIAKNSILMMVINYGLWVDSSELQPHQTAGLCYAWLRCLRRVRSV